MKLKFFIFFNLCKIFIYFFLISINLMADRITSRIDDWSYFVLEKVAEQNVNQWYEFVDNANRNQDSWRRNLTIIKGILSAEELDDFSFTKPIEKIKNIQIKDLIKNKENPLLILQKKYTVLREVGDGIGNFKNALGNFSNGQSDVWIAYITLIDPDKKMSKKDKIANIEMAFVVLIKENSPLSMHMGIFRNPSYFMSNKPSHERISSMLHAFAAKATLKNYPSLKYMITTPLSSMSNIFKGVLNPNSYAEGMNKKDTWIQRDKEIVSVYNDDFEFALYDRDIEDQQKQLVLLINKENKNQYWWLMSRLHASLDRHPYFVVKINDLANSFTIDF